MPTAKKDQDGAEREEAERNELLKRLLKTPPQPRPKREREDKSSPKRGSNAKGRS